MKGKMFQVGLGIKMKKGMTLIELMIVVCVIGILLIIVVPRAGLMIENARSKATQQNISNLRLAITAYYSDWEDWPIGDPDNDRDYSEHLNLQLFTNALVPEYIKEIPPAILKRGLNNYESSQVYFGGTSSLNSDANHGGWRYYAGTITVNSREKNHKGIFYTDY